MDTLLGDLVANTATCVEKAKEKGQKDKIGIYDIGIFEFIFPGLPNLPELEGMDGDRLRELQNAVQEQLHQRDEERERNITKRVQEFEKTFDFVNSHLLKASKIQDKIENKYNENMQSSNGQYRNEVYKRAENMIPQLDGTFNISDNSDTNLHNYVDLADSNIIPYRTRGQKQRHDENEKANTNRRSALKDDMKPNTNVKTQRQKVPDDKDIDINKIVKGDKPKDDRKIATEIERQSREKEAKRLALEKAKRIQIQKDMKDNEAKRLALEKAQIDVVIEKHRPCTPKTPDEVDLLGTSRNDNING